MDDFQLASQVRNFVETSRNHPARVANESIWMTNVAALCGFQGVAWDSNASSFMPSNDPYWAGARGRVHVNKILPTAQNRLARLCKTPPRFDVRPAGNTTEDRDKARLSLNTLTSLWEMLNVNQRRIALKMWVQQCGHAWMRVGWDETKGNVLTDPLTGESTREGAPFVEEMPPFEVFPPPNAKTEEEVLSIGLATAKVRPLSYFRARFPRGKEVKEETAWLQSIAYENQINNMTAKAGFSSVSSSGSTNTLKDSAIELVRYYAPTEEFPEGRMVTVANGIVLQDKPLPIGEIPFRKFDDIPVAGKLYSEAVITHLRPISDQYNRVIARRSDWVNKMLAGKYAAVRGSGLTQEALDDTNGEVVEYDVVPNAPNGGMPMALDIPTIPSYAYNEEETLNAQFADVSGLQEVSQGKMPSASMPAVGMQLLQEQDETRIGIMIEADEYQLAQIGGLILKFFKKFATTPRKLKFAGKLGQYEVTEITGDMLGEPDVICIRGSTYPGSKTLKREEVFRLYQAGFLGDPADPRVREKALGMMEYGDVGDAWTKHSVQTAYIKRIIKALEAAEPVEISKFDNHKAILDELDLERMGDKATANPDYKMRIEALMDQIVAYVQDQAIQAAGVQDPGPAPQLGPVPAEQLPNEEPQAV